MKSKLREFFMVVILVNVVINIPLFLWFRSNLHTMVEWGQGEGKGREESVFPLFSWVEKEWRDSLFLLAIIFFVLIGGKWRDEERERVFNFLMFWDPLI